MIMIHENLIGILRIKGIKITNYKTQETKI